MSFATISPLFPEAASVAFSAVGVPAIVSSHAAAAPYVSGCRTHAQQLDLYASIHEADVLLGLLLKLISDKPNGIVLCIISLL
jgi:L-lactate permease